MAGTSGHLLFPEKHPFQLHILPGPIRPYEVIEMDAGLFVRLDMPGVARNALEIFKNSEKDMVAFRGTAPKKDGFPLDESERLYAGVVRLNKDHPNDLSVDVFVENGSVFLFFPTADGYLLFLPQPGSQAEGECSSSGESTDQDEGSEKSEENEDSSEKSIDKTEGSVKHGSSESASDESVEGCKCEELEKSEENEDSSKKSIEKAEGFAKSESGESASNESSEGLEKSEENEDSSKKSIDKVEGCNCEGIEKSEENEDYAEKSMDEAEGSVKSGSDDSASYESTEGPAKSSLNKSSSKAIVGAWIIASIKAYLLKVNTPEPPKEKSALVETSSTEQSNHEVPEIAIGSVEEMDIHNPDCQCQLCDSDGVCVKTWSTTENNLAYINKLKIKGPDGVCEKRVIQEEGQYSLYVRADLPGLEPACNVVPIEDRCILVFGVPKSLERCTQGARIYLFFVQLQCSCCKFDNPRHDYEDGVLRLFCKIIAPEPGPFAD